MSLFRAIERFFTCPSYHNQKRYARAVFSAGCFWHVQHEFHDRFHDRGLIVVFCAYTGDDEYSFPTYSYVGKHVESVVIYYDPSVIKYEELVAAFFEMHDASQVNGQGPDKGHQYRSIIWVDDQAQRLVASRFRDRYNLHYQKEVNGLLCATRILPTKKFWLAERVHQGN